MDELYVLVRKADSHMETAYRRVGAAYGLRPTALQALLVFYENNWPLNPTTLASILLMPPTSFTPVLDNLEVEGFIRRSHSESDRRVIDLTLTEKALALKPEIVERAGEVQRAFAMMFPYDLASAQTKIGLTSIINTPLDDSEITPYDRELRNAPLKPEPI